MVFDLAMPGEGEGLVAAGEDSPLAGGGRFGVVGEQPATETDVDAVAGNLDGGARDARRRRGECKALFAGVGVDGQRDIEREQRAAWVIKNRRERAGFPGSTGDQ